MGVRRKLQTSRMTNGFVETCSGKSQGGRKKEISSPYAFQGIIIEEKVTKLTHKTDRGEGKNSGGQMVLTEKEKENLTIFDGLCFLCDGFSRLSKASFQTESEEGKIITA